LQSFPRHKNRRGVGGLPLPCGFAWRCTFTWVGILLVEALYTHVPRGDQVKDEMKNKKKERDTTDQLSLLCLNCELFECRHRQKYKNFCPTL